MAKASIWIFGLMKAVLDLLLKLQTAVIIALPFLENRVVLENKQKVLKLGLWLLNNPLKNQIKLLKTLLGSSTRGLRGNIK